MQIQLISQRYFEDLKQFENNTPKLRWDRLALVADGEYIFYADGEEKPKIAHKNEIAFLPAGVTIKRSLTAPLSFYHVSFVTQAEHPFRMALKPGILRIPDEQVTAIFNSMKQAVLMPNNQELIEHTVAHILAENYLFAKEHQVPGRSLSEEVLKSIRYMNAHLHEKIDIDALAERVYLSHTGLLWKFKHELNTTPSNYLAMIRMRYAKQLLLDHDYTITEIAEQCGYSNPYYFTNAFHRYTGQSPTEFRRSYFEGLENK